MHLADVIALRASPAAGLLLALTERCPLRCAHCSTDSGMGSPQHDAGPFRAVVGSFTEADHPQLIFMSGGEPLLRPGLVTDLANRARTTRTKSAVLSGMFFARGGGGTIPPAIRRAAEAVDHFSASIDAYHEREVSRDNVFSALRAILELTPGVSIHATGSEESYLDDLPPR